MKVLVQKVTSASVTVDGQIVSEITDGYLLLVGVEKGDDKSKAEYLAKKVANFRIFADENDKMNLSVTDVRDLILRPCPKMPNLYMNILLSNCAVSVYRSKQVFSKPI